MDPSFAFADDRRVHNLVWTGARSYDFEPDFMALDLSGNADFYMNLIMGCAYYRYGRENLEALFALWEDSPFLSRLDQLTWFALECAVYPKEAEERPSLEGLRRASAEAFLDPAHDLLRRNFALQNGLLFELKQARALDVLGLDQKRMPKKSRLFYRAFQFETTPDFSDFRKLLLDLYQTHFYMKVRRRPPSALKKGLLGFWQKFHIPLIRRASPSALAQKGQSRGRILGSGFGTLGFSSTQRADQRLRDRLTYEFGPSLLKTGDLKALEKAFAPHGHKGSRLWICHQRGDFPLAKGPDGYALDIAAQQKEATFQAYRKRQAFYRQSVDRLSTHLQLMLASDMVPGYNPSRFGNVLGALAYRSQIPGQDKIFHRHTEIPAPEFGVDLVLDASASRMGHVEDIAIQTAILAQSLERNQIPVRVVAYCTFQNHTILTILKDFNAPLDLNKLFAYHALGWNRDGLVYRAMQVLLPDRPFYSHLILVLTDGAPNDFRPLQVNWRLPKAYSGKVGLEDAAEGLDALRQPGIQIAALISGIEEPQENIHRLFGNHYERLADTGQLVSKAKKLILSAVHPQ